MFYDNFKRLCISRGKSPSAVGLDIGIQKSTVTRWKQGSQPSPETLQKISAYFGVPTQKLLADNAPAPTRSAIHSRQGSIPSKRLKELRLASELSQQAVASELGITQQAYAYYESGKRQPGNEMLLRLSELFDVSVDYLLGLPKRGPSTIRENRIRELRKQHKMTMKQLGQVVGLAESTISQYETGKRQPDNETLLRLGEFFDVSVEYLLGMPKRDPTITVQDESGAPVVLDDETLEYIDSLRSRPEMKMLFSVSKNATKEDIIKAVRIIEALKDDK